MGIAMLGVTVAKAMKEELSQRAEKLIEKGIHPQLAILRVGARPDDLSYERGARKRMELVGIQCQVTEVEESVSQEELDRVFEELNRDERIHGILVFQPFPSHLNAETIKNTICPKKDVDGMSPTNKVRLFSGVHTGFAPCTAEAVMEMLDHYEIPISGKRVVILGRSMVIGKPLAMLMLERNATVTICHSKTENLEQICQEAEILVAAAGQAKMVSDSMVREGAVVVDVGIHVEEDGSMCGDVDYDSVLLKASYVSKVPGGVGSITTSVLAKHVLDSAESGEYEKREMTRRS